MKENVLTNRAYVVMYCIVEMCVCMVMWGVVKEERVIMIIMQCGVKE